MDNFRDQHYGHAPNLNRIMLIFNGDCVLCVKFVDDVRYKVFRKIWGVKFDNKNSRLIRTCFLKLRMILVMQIRL